MKRGGEEKTGRLKAVGSVSARRNSSPSTSMPGFHQSGHSGNGPEGKPEVRRSGTTSCGVPMAVETQQWLWCPPGGHYSAVDGGWKGLTATSSMPRLYLRLESGSHRYARRTRLTSVREDLRRQRQAKGRRRPKYAAVLRENAILRGAMASSSRPGVCCPTERPMGGLTC